MPDIAPKYTLDHSTSRTVAALLGTALVAIGLGIALALVLPLRLNERYLVGWFSVFPLWVGLSCWVFLAKSARRAWLIVGLCALATGIVAVAALWLGPVAQLSGVGP
jgi:FtsH-binding integral membrane protein